MLHPKAAPLIKSWKKPAATRYAANHQKYVEPVPKHATPYDPDKNAFHDALNPPPAGPNPALIPVAR